MSTDPPYSPLDEKLISALQESPNGLNKRELKQKFPAVGWDTIIRRLRVLREPGVVDYWSSSHVPPGFSLQAAPTITRWVVLEAGDSEPESIEDFSLTLADEEMLKIFMSHPDGLGVRELVVLQGRDRSTVHRRILKLHRMGFLNKTEVPLEGGRGFGSKRMLFQPILVE